MLGNVYEWCQDRWESYPKGENNAISDDVIISIDHTETNPRILRGGAFSNRPALVRSANRGWYLPSDRDINDGFRIARTYP